LSLTINDKKKEKIIGLLADEKCFWGFYSVERRILSGAGDTVFEDIAA